MRSCSRSLTAIPSELHYDPTGDTLALTCMLGARPALFFHDCPSLSPLLPFAVEISRASLPHLDQIKDGSASGTTPWSSLL